MSIDIELNQLSEPKVIEIGAVVFKSHNGEVLDTFQTYVYPNEPITEFIINLTGITDDKVQGAPSIQEAYFKLKEFHEKHKCFQNPVLWGSGVRNDSNSIWQEAKVEEPNFMGFRVIDAKTIYQSLRIYQNNKVKAGLKAACEELGIGWDPKYGKEHGALSDAYNTYRVWFHIMDKFGSAFPKKGKKVVYIDMDGVIANFDGAVSSGVSHNPPEMFEPGFFRSLNVMPGAKEGVAALLANPNLKVYIGTKHTTKTDYSPSEKVGWIREHFPSLVKRMFIVTDKLLLRGDYLIDDDKKWEKFPGEFVHFDRTKPEEEWKRIVEYLKEKV
jgi:inhibitor of KinA sporulation pathway (predicted exonuclease)/5'(3')-deoxyribonucleotidase